MQEGEPRPRRSLGNDAAALSGAAVLSAIVAYGLLLVIVNGLGAEEAAPVVLIWSYWVVATAALGIPVQQWIVRNSVVGVDALAERATMRRLWGLVGLIALAVTGTGWMLGERLFDDASWIYPASLGATTVGAWALGVARGRLAAAGRYYSLAASLPGENLVRLAIAIALVAVGADGRAAALVVPGGYVILAALGTRQSRSVRATSAPVRTNMLGALTVIAMLSQTMFSSVPFLIALGGGAASAVTATFALVAVARVPHLVANAIAPRILDSMTAVAVSSPRRVWSIRRTIILAVPPIAISAGLFAAGTGRELVRWVFGLDEAVPGSSAVLITVGAVVAVGVLLQALSGVAVGRPKPVITSGFAGLAAGVCVVAIVNDAGLRASLAFAVAEIVYFAGLSFVAFRERTRLDVRP